MAEFERNLISVRTKFSLDSANNQKTFNQFQRAKKILLINIIMRNNFMKIKIFQYILHTNKLE